MRKISNTLLLSAIIFISYSCFSQNNNNENKENSTKDNNSISINDTIIKEKKEKEKTISIVAVGDIMLGTIVPNRTYLPPNGNSNPLLMPLKSILSDADITFGNLEGVFTDTNKGAKNCNNPKTCFTFGMPTSFCSTFKDVGFDILSLANNHSGDFGAKGRTTTTTLLNKYEIQWAGLTSQPFTIFIRDSIKYGFCAFAPNSGTVQITDIANAQKIVEKLDAECDIVIVSFHGGAEGKKHQHVTKKYEHFLGQNRGNVYDFAHKVIDAGADIVLGHGPHVSRAIELYKNRFITYSMGNFATYSRINITGVSGIAPIYKVYIDTNGNFLKAELIPTFQIKYKGGPKIDPNKKVIKVVRDLTNHDFPNGLLKIDNNGLITKK